MSYSTMKIPSVIIGSEFPDRDKIIILSEWKPKQIYGDMEVYQIRSNDETTVQLPTELFSYDSKTKTLSHLTFPEFDICNEDDHMLFWYLSKEGEHDMKAVERRYQFFLKYFCEQNVLSDVFRFCTGLKYLGFHDWHKYPHPIKFYFSYGGSYTHGICRFDPTKYLVRSSEKYNDGIELVNLADNSVFLFERIRLSQHAFNHRYLINL